jgi:uncharacterized oxidoreductase
MVEVLAGILTGLGYGVAADGRHNDGCFMAVFDVERFLDGKEFRAQMNGFVDFLKATEPAAGFSEVLYPGEVEWRLAERHRSQGIEVEDSTWKKLVALAEASGLTPPAVTA